MDTVFISRLKTLLDAVAETMHLYVPRQVDEHYVCVRYDTASETPPQFNPVRMCTPVKEFLFPLRELAAMFPEPLEPALVQPFAVFGLKACDLRSLGISGQGLPGGRIRGRVLCDPPGSHVCLSPRTVPSRGRVVSATFSGARRMRIAVSI